MTLVLTLLVIIAIVAIVIGIDRATASDPGPLQERLLRYGARRLIVVDDVTGETRSRSAATIALTSTVSRAIQGRSFAQGLLGELARADLKLTAAEFFTIQIGLGFAMGLLGSVLLRNPLALPILGLVGFQLPKVWLGRRQSARLKAFNDQLADTITLMSNSMRSGMSLLQAMEMVSREGAAPMSAELSRVVREVGLGVSPEEALQHLVARMRSDDLDLMVTAILVQHEVGGNLARILDTISNTIRERVKIKGEIRAITGQQRMAGFMLVGLPIFVAGALSLIAPRYLFAMFVPGPWLALPVAAVIGIVIGFVIIQRIVAIEV